MSDLPAQNKPLPDQNSTRKRDAKTAQEIIDTRNISHSHTQDESEQVFTEDKPSGSLRGWRPNIKNDASLLHAMERAFEYRGDVSIILQNNELGDNPITITGYVFNIIRGSNFKKTALCVMLRNICDRRALAVNSDIVNLRASDIQMIAFTGIDAAAGKTWDAWVDKQNKK